MPELFRYFSFFGGIMLLAYACYRVDPVFIIGQATGLVIYTRNLYFILARQAHAKPGQARLAGWRGGTVQLKDLTLAEQLRHKKAVKTRLDRFRNEDPTLLDGVESVVSSRSIALHARPLRAPLLQIDHYGDRLTGSSLGVWRGDRGAFIVELAVKVPSPRTRKMASPRRWYF